MKKSITTRCSIIACCAFVLAAVPAASDIGIFDSGLACPTSGLPKCNDGSGDCTGGSTGSCHRCENYTTDKRTCRTSSLTCAWSTETPTPYNCGVRQIADCDGHGRCWLNAAPDPGEGCGIIDCKTQ